MHPAQPKLLINQLVLEWPVLKWLVSEMSHAQERRNRMMKGCKHGVMLASPNLEKREQDTSRRVA